jgi:hypothetical protein
VDYESFLDDELVSELLFIYLEDREVSKKAFAKYIFGIENDTFLKLFQYYGIWHLRTPKGKKLFHKAKNIINLKPFSKAMTAFECAIYKQRMMTLGTLLGKNEYAFTEFAKDRLGLSLSEFLVLKENCIQEVPLDEISKEYMNKISEFITEHKVQLRNNYLTYKRIIKGKYFSNTKNLTDFWIIYFKDRARLQNLCDVLKTDLEENHIPYRLFSKQILNLPINSFEMVLYFQKRKQTSVNMLIVNAMYRWLKDENRLQKLDESKYNSEFYYMDESTIEDNVRKLFIF